MIHHRWRAIALKVTMAVLTGSACMLFSIVAGGEPQPTAAPTVVQDAIAGHWLYRSDALRVEITRKTDADIPLIWYEADLRCSPDAVLSCVLSAEKYPAKHLQKPDVIAQREALVYAQTDDFFGDRVDHRKLKTGVIIRDGKLLFNDVYRGSGKPFPPLDAMALFPDGTLECFAAREYTGEQYLAMGAQDVLSFGPILIRDGEMDARLIKGYADREPRSAIGMIEPYHYFAIVVEGRHEGSVGCGLEQIVEWMLAQKVTEAINLDGGQTAAMVFMGCQLNLTGKYKRNVSVRSVSGVLGIRDQNAEK